MAVLASGTVPIPAGFRQSSSFAVPSGTKQPGVALWLVLEMDGDVFPTGTTRIQIEFSYDSGLTWRGAAADCGMPRTWPPGRAHTFGIAYCFGPDDEPTHARYITNAPQAFNCAVTLSTR